MNKKMIAVVMLVVVGTLAVSAFSWTPGHDANHEGWTIYHQSEWNANAKFYELQGTLDTTEQKIENAESARWMGAALASQAQATEQQFRNIESARWMGAALASHAQEMAQLHYGPPGR